MTDRLETFWTELAALVGSDFSGNVVLHCAKGMIVKYEVHEVRRPRGGSVDLNDSVDEPARTALRSNR
jgi:hypothetical protein